MRRGPGSYQYRVKLERRGPAGAPRRVFWVPSPGLIPIAFQAVSFQQVLSLLTRACGARTPACRVATLRDASRGFQASSERRQECRRCTQECVRHGAFRRLSAAT